MKRDSLTELQKAKEELRRSMRTRLQEIDPGLRAEMSLMMCQLAVHLPEFIASRCVALFAPLPSEPDIHPLIEEAWAHGKRVVLPVMIPHGNEPQLDWHAVTSWEDVVMPGPLGLREPDPLRCPRVAITELDCAFIPGLAFDHDGLRLGRGGGFYDFFLSRAPALLPRVGLMFDCQRVASVPRELHDQGVNATLTENKVWHHRDVRRATE